MTTEIQFETKKISHDVYGQLSDSKAMVKAAMTSVNNEQWHIAHGDIELAIASLERARDKTKAAWEKHGVRD